MNGKYRSPLQKKDVIWKVGIGAVGVTCCTGKQKDLKMQKSVVLSEYKKTYESCKSGK